jgi:hypothetical protein
MGHSVKQPQNIVIIFSDKKICYHLLLTGSFPEVSIVEQCEVDVRSDAKNIYLQSLRNSLFIKVTIDSNTLI